jgi:CRP/FNR family transcriptional regulator
MRLAENVNTLDGLQTQQSQHQPGLGRQKCQDCFLQRHCLPHSLDDRSRTALGEITAHPKPFHKGRYIYRQNSPFSSIYIVRSSVVKTYYFDERGDEHITGFYLPGEMFGIDGIGRSNYRYNAQALGTTAICVIDYNALEHLYPQFAEIQQQVTAALCEELFERQQSLLNIRQQPAEERLASFLVDISRRVQKQGQLAREFHLPMPRRDIAGYLGVAEETLCRIFRRLQDRNFLVIEGRQVIDLDLDSLLAMSVSVN